MAAVQVGRHTHSQESRSLGTMVLAVSIRWWTNFFKKKKRGRGVRTVGKSAYTMFSLAFFVVRKTTNKSNLETKEFI